MKLISTILFLLLSNLVLSQTKLDSLVLVEINSYRVSNGLKSLNPSDLNFKASNYHSKYLVKNNKIGHSEDTLTNPIDRLLFFGGKTNHIGENVTSVNINVKEDNVDLVRVSKVIVDSWIKSPEHNKILLSKDFKFAGVSCITTSKSTGIKGWSNLTIVSTLVVTN